MTTADENKAIKKARDLNEEFNRTYVVFWLGECWQVASLEGFMKFHNANEVQITHQFYGNNPSEGKSESHS